MDAEHPRDVDPSITGQPHQVTGKVPDLMGNTSRTLGNSTDMPAAVPTGTAATLFPASPRVPHGMARPPEPTGTHRYMSAVAAGIAARPSGGTPLRRHGPTETPSAVD
ncbi:hypothetical protein ACFXOM_29865 [Streptomyces sp. NPDC059169]|uniref:hypothetical protein n=1 Tax=Streptomyces sp. NPDC059169 TaxID=3346754 RepID=UPI0036A43102